MPEARERREMLEEVIDDARNKVVVQCQRIGGALHGIRTEKLYADDYETFDDYVRLLWDFDPVCAGNWITASQVADTLQEFGLAIDQLTKSAAIALSKTDDPVQVWSEVSAASPSPTALEIEQVAKLHLPLLAGAEGLTKGEEQEEIATAEQEIDKAVALGRLIAIEKKARSKITNFRTQFCDPIFKVLKPRVARLVDLLDEVLAELGE